MVNDDNSEELRRKARHPTIGVHISAATTVVVGAVCAVFVYGRDVDNATAVEDVSVAVDGPSSETQNEPKVVDPLRRRIHRFRVQNIPLGYAVSALNELGLRVCYEAPGDFHEEWYIDDAGRIKGTGVFFVNIEGNKQERFPSPFLTQERFPSPF